jgi:hypothetical protein
MLLWSRCRFRGWVRRLSGGRRTTGGLPLLRLPEPPGPVDIGRNRREHDGTGAEGWSMVTMALCPPSADRSALGPVTPPNCDP